jgi:hypothetical protein
MFEQWYDWSAILDLHSRVVLPGSHAEVFPVVEIPHEWLDGVVGILESLNQGVLINNDCGEVVFANALYLKMVGKSADDIIPKERRNCSGKSSAARGKAATFLNSTCRTATAATCRW